MNVTEFNGSIDYAAIERNARRMRAEMTAAAVRALTRWVAAHLTRHGHATPAQAH